MRFVDPQPNSRLHDWAVEIIGAIAVVVCLVVWPPLFAAMFSGGN